MNDKASSVAPSVDDEDLDTTAPNMKPAEWKMPEPVFRKTSGRLPQAFEKNYAAADPQTPIATPDEADRRDEDIAPKPKNPTLKMIVVFLGLAAMIAFIAVFLTVVYFFFLR